MSRAVKEKIVGEIADRFRGVEGAILVDFTGLDSGQTYDLRKSLHERQVRMHVIPNRLARIGFGGLGLGAMSELLDGPTAVAYGEDSVAVAKTLVEWKKKNKKATLALKGGVLQGKLLSVEEVEQLAQTPDRHTLHAMLVNVIASPLTGFVGALAGVLRKPLYALKALEEKRRESEGGSAPEAPAS